MKKILDKVILQFSEEHNFFNEPKDAKGNYTLEAAIESILDYTILTGDTAYLSLPRQVFRNREYCFSDTIPYESLPFSNPYFSWYLLNDSSAFVIPFLSESKRMETKLARTKDGAICINHEGGNYMLIDYLQEYASRMAKTGYLTQDTLFFRECVTQFSIYREILQDKETKLYHQGRGWLPDINEISPGVWSRGQGWLMRGMVSSLLFLPAGSQYYIKLQSYLKEFADGLIQKQDEDGMWHTLVHLPHAESYPETSGTALIAGYLAIAYHKGFLKDPKYKNAALKAVEALTQYIDEDGTISYVSKGPGPLRKTEDYKKLGIDTHHGYFSVVYALTGWLLLHDIE